MNSLHQLCKICQATVSDPESQHLASSHPGYRHQPTIRALQDSAKNNCHLCALFWASLLLSSDLKALEYPWLHGDWFDAEDGPLYLCISSGITRLVDTRFLDDQQQYTRELELSIQSSKFQDCVSSKVKLGKLVDSETGAYETLVSDKLSSQTPARKSTYRFMKSLALGTDPASINNFRLMRRWLHDCINGHPGCLTLGDGPPALPTRAIDVGPSNGSREPYLDITEGRRGDYVSLSHRWGQLQIITTTQSTISQRKHGIDIISLPKTFQDAVLITRQLGVRYLWIDSLCIIQDSPRDWEVESAKMHKVYQHALFNISADGAEDSSVGCFLQRNTLEMRPCRIDWPDAGMAACPSFKYSGINMGPSAIKDSLLSRRGWILQERLLSTRILHFTKQEILWECDSIMASERLPISARTGRQPDAAMRALLKPRQGPQNLRNLSTLEPRNVYDAWYELVEKYTGRELTQNSDRLPALAGIVGAINTILYRNLSLHDTYLAGIWREDLKKGLFWNIKSVYSKIPSTDKPHSPLWSWANIKEQISYYHSDPPPGKLSDCEVEILSAHVTLVGSEASGAVKCGTIILRGVMKKAVFSFAKNGDDDLLLRIEADSDEYESTWYSANIHYDREIDPEVSEVSERAVWCLRMSAKEATSYTPELARALVLVPTFNVKNEYRRFGIIDGIANKWFDGCSQTVVTLV
ncbi:HET-domain-containing protein [Stipitochalara longipes BDJ]|nr:HET-domain-containing protein [Stipitochalara longipes BDJ]